MIGTVPNDTQLKQLKRIRNIRRKIWKRCKWISQFFARVKGFRFHPRILTIFSTFVGIWFFFTKIWPLGQRPAGFNAISFLAISFFLFFLPF